MSNCEIVRDGEYEFVINTKTGHIEAYLGGTRIGLLKELPKDILREVWKHF